jgi:hypothetical protein
MRWSVGSPTSAGLAPSHRHLAFTPPAIVECEFARTGSAPVSSCARQLMGVVATFFGVSHDPVVRRGFRPWKAIEQGSLIQGLKYQD